MNPFFEAIASASFACAGALLGFLFSRLPKPYWVFGYFIPLALILIYGVAVHFPVLSFTPPISWMMIGRKKFAVMGFIATMVLTTPLSRLPQKRDRAVVLVLMTVIVLVMSVWPFLAPIFNHNQLEHLQTRIGADGVCRQNTDYTCGPAAAVTALRKLGLPADEGQIAILSYTSSTTGKPPDILAEIPQAARLIKLRFMVDHYVTVLEVTDSEVVIGDPLNGLDRISRDEFLKKWRFAGVVLKRQP